MFRMSEFLPSPTEASRSCLDELIQRNTKHALINYALNAEREVWYIHEGDLLVPGDVYNDINLIVTGDFIVHGCYDDYIQSYIGSLLCYGNMWAEHVFSWGAMYIDKDLLVDGLVHNYYNDHSFEVNGTVCARVVLIDDKATNDPTYDCEVFANSNSLDWKQMEKAVKKLRALFPALTWDPDGDFDKERIPDWDRMRAHYYQGAQLFLKPRPPLKKSDNDVDRTRKELSMKTASEKQLKAIATQKDHQFSVTVHPACPDVLLAEFASAGDARLRWAVASNPRTSKDVLTSLTHDDSENVRQTLAMNPSTPDSVLDELASDKSSKVTNAVAARKILREPLEIGLKTLDEYRQEDEQARANFEKEDPGPDFSELDRLLAGTESQRKELASAAIRSEGLFNEYQQQRDRVLEKLMLDSSAQVREIASCAWLKQKFYEENEQRLLDDNVNDIRFVLALRARNEKALRRLVKDASFEVRVAVLMNPNTPVESLTWVANTVDSTKQTEEEMAEIIGGYMQNALVPPDVISSLYHKYPNQALSRHCNAPPDVVAAQLSSELQETNSLLAQKVSAAKSPDELFTLLANSGVTDLERVAAINRHTPTKVLLELYKNAPTDSELLRWTLAANPNLPEKLMKKYTKSTLRGRINLASNPSCPVEILRQLATSDDAASVRQAAKLTLQKLHGEDVE